MDNKGYKAVAMDTMNKYRMQRHANGYHEIAKDITR